jgi:Cu-Zn family superoxide dismutase
MIAASGIALFAYGANGVRAGVTAQVHDVSGHDLGTLTLTDSAKGIVVSGMLHGLPPGTHAIHVHATGKCDAPGFTSAGGHWNPTNRHHGAQNPEGAHLGDMENFVVGADSMATIHVMTPGGSLHAANALMDSDGAAVVVHAVADDYHSDPAGNAGNRIACGVVAGS